MCGAIEYVFNEKRYIATPDTQASALPIRLKGAALMLAPWGRPVRTRGRRFAPITWPAEPWLELEAIKRKALADCAPRPVRIAAVRFMVYLRRNAVTIDHWVTLAKGPRWHLTGGEAHDITQVPALIACFFSRLKQFRRIATRYDKLARNFLSMLNLAAAYIWLA